MTRKFRLATLGMAAALGGAVLLSAPIGAAHAFDPREAGTVETSREG